MSDSFALILPFHNETGTLESSDFTALSAIPSSSSSIIIARLNSSTSGGRGSDAFSMHSNSKSNSVSTPISSVLSSSFGSESSSRNHRTSCKTFPGSVPAVSKSFSVSISDILLVLSTGKSKTRAFSFVVSFRLTQPFEKTHLEMTVPFKPVFILPFAELCAKSKGSSSSRPDSMVLSTCPNLGERCGGH